MNETQNSTSAEDMFGGLWLPPEASTFASESDALYFFILYLCIFFFVLLMGLMVYYAVKYRRRGDDDKTSPISHSFKLEFLWSAIPTVLLMWIFAWGQQGFNEYATPPNDPLEIRVVAKKWQWNFAYPSLARECAPQDPVVAPVWRPCDPNAPMEALNPEEDKCKADTDCVSGVCKEGPTAGVKVCHRSKGCMKGKCKPPVGEAWEAATAPKNVCWEKVQTPTRFVVPKGRAVNLTMSSEDVIHSLWIPAFRTKRDVLPNRYTGYWFEATKEGTFDVYCSEYCGEQHMTMGAKVEVVSPEAWEDWLKGNECKVQDTDGKGLFRLYGCATCHSVDGSKMTGPSLKGIYGKEEAMSDGRKIKVDDNYIRKSIMNPNADVVAGYAPQMPSFAGRIKNETQLNALIDYIKCAPVGPKECKSPKGGK